MNTKLAITLGFLVAVFSLTLADKIEEPQIHIENVIGYAEQFVDCLRDCKEKYSKNGYKRTYPQKENECKLTCEENFSAEYGSFGFYPEKEFECNQKCNETYGKHGTTKHYPEKNAECHQSCKERYGFRKPLAKHSSAKEN